MNVYRTIALTLISVVSWFGIAGASGESLIVTPEGKVGIGTATPTAELEVNGEIKAQKLTLQEPIVSIEAGSVIGWFTTTPPDGYLECDGSTVSRATYNKLFSVIGTSFGPGDGSTTFNLPDLRGRFLRGWDHGAGSDPNAATRTNRGDGTTGDAVGTIQDDQVQSHSHSVNPPNTSTSSAGNHKHPSAAAASGISAGGGGSSAHAQEGSGTGYAGNHSHSVNIPAFNSAAAGGSETRPKNISVMWIIKY